MPSGATILHADLDAFYASVEQLLRPCAAREADRRRWRRGAGCVVRGQTVRRARRNVRVGGPSSCAPTSTFVSGHFSEYQRLGDEVMAILGDFTPLVQRISIDEAFLDVTGSVHLFGDAGAIGETIRRRCATELGLPISVGAARTKHLAKIASQVAKPDGLVVVPPADRARLPRSAARRAGVGHRAGHPGSASPSAASTPSASWRPRPTARCSRCSAGPSAPRSARSPPTTTAAACSRPRARRVGRRPVGVRAT